MTDQAAAAPTPVVMPTTPEGARAVINTRLADSAWGAKVLAGDVTARNELDTLHKIEAGDVEAITAAKAAAPPPASEQPPKTAEQLGAELSAAAHDHEVSNLLSSVREKFEINEEAERRLRSGEPFSQADHDLFKGMKARCMSDPDWAARLTKGDPRAARELFLMNLALSNGVKQENAP